MNLSGIRWLQTGRSTVATAGIFDLDEESHRPVFKSIFALSAVNMGLIFNNVSSKEFWYVSAVLLWGGLLVGYLSVIRNREILSLIVTRKMSVSTDGYGRYLNAVFLIASGGVLYISESLWPAAYQELVFFLSAFLIIGGLVMTLSEFYSM